MNVGGFYLIAIIAFGASLLIQWWLRSTYETWMKRGNTSGLTGRDAALAILEANGHLIDDPDLIFAGMVLIIPQ